MCPYFNVILKLDVLCYKSLLLVQRQAVGLGFVVGWLIDWWWNDGNILNYIFYHYVEFRELEAGAVLLQDFALLLL
jgi:hypothetical protein